MDWSKIGNLITTELPVVIRDIEATKGAKTGTEKQQAMLRDVLDGFSTYKSASGKDVLHDPRVTAALVRASDALVNAQNVIAQVDAEP